MSQLVSPRQRLNQQREGLQSLTARLHRAARRNTELEAARLNLLKTRLNAALPSVARRRQELDRLTQRLAAVGSRQFRRPRARLEAAEQTLQALSPKHILARGYALVRDQNGVLVKNALDLNAGDRLLLELAQGAADVEVLKTRSLL